MLRSRLRRGSADSARPRPLARARPRARATATRRRTPTRPTAASAPRASSAWAPRPASSPARPRSWCFLPPSPSTRWRSGCCSSSPSASASPARSPALGIAVVHARRFVPRRVVTSRVGGPAARAFSSSGHRHRTGPGRSGRPRSCLTQGGLAMSFDFLFQPAEQLDHLLEGLFAGATLPVALLVAFLLGLRHASDPDHLVAVTSLVAAEGGDTRKAARPRRLVGPRARGVAARARHPAHRLQGAAPRLARERRREGHRRRDPRSGRARDLQVGARRLPRHRHTTTSTATRAAGTCGSAEGAAIVTCESAAAGRRCRSACSTASPAPAPWCSS